LAGTISDSSMLDGISTAYLNRLYPEQWVLAEVLDADARKRPTRVRVIAHSANRQDIHSVLMRSHGHLVLLFVGAPRTGGVAF
jgi:hypothetical protein